MTTAGAGSLGTESGPVTKCVSTIWKFLKVVDHLWDGFHGLLQSLYGKASE